MQLARELHASGRDLTPVKHVLDELSIRLSGNKIAAALLDVPFQKLIPSVQDGFERLTRKLGALHAQLNAYRYLQEIRSTVIHEIESDNPSKIELSWLLSEYVTTVVGLGVAPSFIYTSITHRLKQFDRDRPFVERLQNLFSAISENRSLYSVLLRVKIDVKTLAEDHYSFFGVTLSRDFPEEFMVAKKANPKCTDAEIFARVEHVEANDPHSAVQNAREQISTLFDLVGLYEHKAKFELAQDARVFDVTKKKATRVTGSKNRMHFVAIYSDDDAKKRLSRAISDLRVSSAEEARKFSRGLELHGSALSSEDPSAQLLSLWTAFEVVARNNPGRRVVDDVVDSVVPVLNINYMQRLFSQLEADLNRQAGRNVAEVKKDMVDQWGREWLMHLILSPDQAKVRDSVISSVSANSLLVFRCSELYRKFIDPDAALLSLKNHEKMVTWQLHRIARARNAITHTGGQIGPLSALVENAHSYFDQVFIGIADAFSVGSRFMRMTDGNPPRG